MLVALQSSDPASVAALPLHGPRRLPAGHSLAVAMGPRPATPSATAQEAVESPALAQARKHKPQQTTLREAATVNGACPSAAQITALRTEALDCVAHPTTQPARLCFSPTPHRTIERRRESVGTAPTGAERTAARLSHCTAPVHSNGCMSTVTSCSWMQGAALASSNP